MVGISHPEYCDIESYDDEIEQSVSISVLKKIGLALDLEMPHVLGDVFSLIRLNDSLVSFESVSNTDGIDFDALSDKVGLIEHECARAIEDINVICEWPLFAFIGFCEYFSLDPKELFERLNCEEG